MLNAWECITVCITVDIKIRKAMKPAFRTIAGSVALLYRWFTSGTGLLGDLRSLTFGLLSFGVFKWLEEGGVSDSNPVVFSWRATRGVIFSGPEILCGTFDADRGEILWGTSEDALWPESLRNTSGRLDCGEFSWATSEELFLQPDKSNESQGLI